MPLFDYNCGDCGRGSTLLLKYGDSAACPTCGSSKMAKQLSPFAFAIGGATAAGGVAASAANPGASAAKASVRPHVHGPGCGHERPTEGCPSSAHAAALVKKYLD